MSEVEYTKMKQGGNQPPPPYGGGYPPQGYSQTGYPPQEGFPYLPADNQQPKEVIVGQPGPAPPVHVKEVVYQSPPANDFLIFTIITMIVFCFLGGMFGACISIPALIFALMAQSKNDSGNTQEARKYGRLALCWNIGVIVYHVILWIIFIAIIAAFAAGSAHVSDSVSDSVSSIASTASTGGSSEPGTDSSMCTYVLTQVCNVWAGCYYQYKYKCS